MPEEADFRLQAAASGETISHKEEGYVFAIALRLAGLCLWIATFGYILVPAYFQWATMPLPNWLRWIGVVTGDAAMLERAAQSGDAEAKMRLGEIEYQRKKRREAFKLFRAAADAGYAPAMVRVGDCHLNGDGASVSEIDAVNWYRKAALAGNQDALDKLRKLGKTQ